MSVIETFFGYVETTRDSLLLFEACKRGLLPRVNRRLQEKERQLVRSGAVFCFDENESGIKRWTDGLVWSPSRILGNFLIYRELDKAGHPEDEDDAYRKKGTDLSNRRRRERALVGSLKNSYRFKEDGLIKKSMSLVINGVQQHLISYYNKDDVLADQLSTPSSMPFLESITISPELLLRQNFRIPLFLNEEMPNVRKSSSTKISRPFNTKKTNQYLDPELLRWSQTSSTWWLAPRGSVDGGICRSSAPSSFSASPACKADSSTVMSTPPSRTAAVADSSASNGLEHYMDRHRYRSSSFTAMHAPPVLPALQQQPSLSERIYDRPHGNYSYNVLPTYSSDIPTRQSTDGGNASSQDERAIPIPPHQVARQTPSQPQHAQNISIRTSSSSLPYNIGSFAAPGKLVSNHSDRADQNPHQHLFSSSSFHTINHAALQTRTEVIANSFMLDPNLIMGLNCEEFEFQL